MMQMKLSRQCDLQGVVVVHRSCQEVLQFCFFMTGFCVHLRGELLQKCLVTFGLSPPAEVVSQA